MRGISCFLSNLAQRSACGVGNDLKLPVDAHPCLAPAESALHRLTEAAYTAICIAYMVSTAPP